jgi:hypothetical protein
MPVWNRIVLALTLALLPVAVLVLCPIRAQTMQAASSTLYVDQHAPGPAHNGSSWAAAYTTLQPALSQAAYGDEIWVADGVYTPTNGVTRTAALALKPGVALYGGFGGYGVSETQRTQRNWTAHKSILSGDVDGNDLNADGNFIAETWNDIRGANAYHVVRGEYVTRSAVLDGFVITAGQADGLAGLHQDRGSGIYNFYGQPTLAHLTILGNKAAGFGGGMYGYQSSPALSDVTFRNNLASSAGGGMHSEYGSSPALTNVIFIGNNGGLGGGGMNNDQDSNPRLVNVAFIGNFTDQYGSGGGLRNWLSSPVLTNVLLSGNQSDWGGGIYSFQNSNPSLFNVTLSGNRALMPDQGQGDSGGGILNDTNSSPQLVNCVVWGNLWLNNPSQVANMNGSSTVVRYTIVQGGYAGTGNSSADPLFAAPVTATSAPTTTGNYHLGYGSPAINAGINLSLTTSVDLDGNPRVTAGTIDMGAYEAQVFVVVTLDGNGLGSVTSNPPGLACSPGLCAKDFLSGTVVTLTAAAHPGSIFKGWSGTVLTSSNSITLSVTTTRNVTATFMTNKVYLPVVARP